MILQFSVKFGLKILIFRYFRVKIPISSRSFCWAKWVNLVKTHVKKDTIEDEYKLCRNRMKVPFQQILLDIFEKSEFAQSSQLICNVLVVTFLGWVSRFHIYLFCNLFTSFGCKQFSILISIHVLKRPFWSTDLQDVLLIFYHDPIDIPYNMLINLVSTQQSYGISHTTGY